MLIFPTSSFCQFGRRGFDRGHSGRSDSSVQQRYRRRGISLHTVTGVEIYGGIYLSLVWNYYMVKGCQPQLSSLVKSLRGENVAGFIGG